MSEHTCHARGCDVPVPRKMFMCRRHWYMLPKAMRGAVWRDYVPGQELDWSKVSDEYLTATREAIEFVAATEGQSE